jgi:hypothetical protein
MDEAYMVDTPASMADERVSAGSGFYLVGVCRESRFVELTTLQTDEEREQYDRRCIVAVCVVRWGRDCGEVNSADAEEEEQIARTSQV